MNLELVFILLLFFIVITLIAYACCIVSGDSNKQRDIEELLKELDDEDE